MKKMKARKLWVILGSICLILVFSVLPFVTACSTASTATTTQAPVTVTQNGDNHGDNHGNDHGNDNGNDNCTSAGRRKRVGFPIDKHFDRSYGRCG